MIPHPGDGIPWSQNLSGSYGPGESGKPQNSEIQKFKIPGILIPTQKKSRILDFGIFGILLSRFFRDLQIPIPISGIFDLALS